MVFDEKGIYRKSILVFEDYLSGCGQETADLLAVDATVFWGEDIKKLLWIGLIVWRENRDTLALFWTARICLRNSTRSVCILFFLSFPFNFFFLENLTIVPTFVTIQQIITFIFFRKFNQSLITKYTKRNGIAFTVHVKVKLLSNSLSLSLSLSFLFFFFLNSSSNFFI